MARRLVVAGVAGLVGWAALLGAGAMPASRPKAVTRDSYYSVEDNAITFRFGATDEDLAVLDDLPDLRVISFSSGLVNILADLPHWAITDKGFLHVGVCRKLQVVQLAGLVPFDLTDRSLEALDGLPELRHVELSMQSFTDAGTAHLANSPKIEELWLDFDRNLGDGTLSTAAKLPKLKSLRVFGAGVTDAGIARMKGLTELEDLEIGSSNVGDEAMKIIVGFPKLTMLDLQATKVTDAGFAKVAGLAHLHTLVINKLPLTDASVDALLKCKALKQVEMNGTKISEAGEKRLKAAGIERVNKE